MIDMILLDPINFALAVSPRVLYYGCPVHRTAASRMNSQIKPNVAKSKVIDTYSELWRASSCVLEAGATNPACSSWSFLSSILLSAFTFEAYVNQVGVQGMASWRNIDRLPPLGKFELLCDFLKVRFRKGTRPLQTIEEMFAFRNTMAQGRTEVLELEPRKFGLVGTVGNGAPDEPTASWETLTETDAFARRAREDVEAILRKLHEARPEPKEALFSLGDSLQT